MQEANGLVLAFFGWLTISGTEVREFVLAIFGFIIGVAILIWFLITLTDIKRATRGTEEALEEFIHLIKERFPPKD